MRTLTDTTTRQVNKTESLDRDHSSQNDEKEADLDVEYKNNNLAE
jgi:hypothetical protein